MAKPPRSGLPLAAELHAFGSRLDLLVLLDGWGVLVWCGLPDVGCLMAVVLELGVRRRGLGVSSGTCGLFGRLGRGVSLTVGWLGLWVVS